MTETDTTTTVCPNCGGDGCSYGGRSDLPYEHGDTICCVCNGTGEVPVPSATA